MFTPDLDTDFHPGSRGKKSLDPGTGSGSAALAIKRKRYLLFVQAAAFSPVFRIHIVVADRDPPIRKCRKKWK
jgi:hypothetical protein